MKYVMITHQYPILFPDHLDHHLFKDIGNITSAGFVDIEDGQAVTHGQSTTLKMKPEAGDDLIIRILLRER